MSDKPEIKKGALAEHISMVYLGEYSAPVFTEPHKEGGLILCGDGEESFFDELIDLRRGSNKHDSIINHQVRYICGKGWAVDKLGKNISELSKIEYFIRKSNSRNENLNTLVKKTTNDKRTFSGFALEVIPNKDGTLEGIYHVNFASIRAFTTGDPKNPIKYCYLPDWKNVRTLEAARSKKGFREWNKFDESIAKTETTLLYYAEPRNVKSGESDVYPIPYYVGCIPYIKCDAEVGSYCVNGIQNEFWGGKMITFTDGAPDTPEAKSAIERKFSRKHTGTKNARRVVLNFVDGVDRKPIVDTLTNEKLSEEFEILNNIVRSEIFTAHGVTHPALFGQSVESGLGGSRDELMDAFDLADSTLISPEQELQASIYNRIFLTFGINASLYLNKVKPLGVKFTEATIVANLDPKDLKNLVYDQLGIQAKTDTVNMSSIEQESNEEFLLKYLESVGEKITSEDLYSDSYKVEMNESKEYLFNDNKFKHLFFSKATDTNLTDIETNVISILSENGATPVEKIAEALDISVDEVTSIINRFKAMKIIRGNIGSNIEITPNGEKFIENNDVPLKVVVRYRYSDKGAPALSKGGKSRSFCQRLMSLSNSGYVWTREQLMLMTNTEGMSAWVHGGGFYTNPITHKTSDQCRHHWEAVIKKLKQ